MPEVGSCAAPSAVPVPPVKQSCCILPCRGREQASGPEPLQPPTREEKGEMQAKLITDVHASIMLGLNLLIDHVHSP